MGIEVLLFIFEFFMYENLDFYVVVMMFLCVIVVDYFGKFSCVEIWLECFNEFIFCIG